MPNDEKLSGRPNGSAPVLLTAAGLAAAFAVASCCALPLILSGLGIGVAWLTGIATFAEPLRGILMAAAAVCLIGAGALLLRQRATTCAPGAVCARTSVRALTVLGLIAGAALLYLGYVYV